jgi:hypothetical protein
LRGEGCCLSMYGKELNTSIVLVFNELNNDIFTL